jgi:rRNA processing protein Gar1
VVEKRLGIAAHVSSQGNLIVRCDGPVNIKANDAVLLREKRIGSIYDVFGPIGKPYVSVKIFDDLRAQAKALINKPVYVAGKREKDESQKRSKNDRRYKTRSY